MRPRVCVVLLTVIASCGAIAASMQAEFTARTMAERIVPRVGITSSYFCCADWPYASKENIRKVLEGNTPDGFLFTEGQLKDHVKRIVKAADGKPSPIDFAAEEVHRVVSTATQRRQRYLIALMDAPDRIQPIRGASAAVLVPPTTDTELEDSWLRFAGRDLAELLRLGYELPLAHATLRAAYDDELVRVLNRQSDWAFEALLNLAYNTLDMHGSFIAPIVGDPAAAADGAEGVGLALRLDPQGRFPTIASLVLGGAAEAAGTLHEGDAIVSVVLDGVAHSTFRNSLEQVVKLLRRPAGTKLRLLVDRGPGWRDSEVGEVELVTQRSTAGDVAASMRLFEIQQSGAQTNGLAYVALPRFVRDSQATSQGEVGAISTTRKLSEWLEARKPSGVVLDMRGNSGGAVVEVAALSKLFAVDPSRAYLKSTSKSSPLSDGGDPYQPNAFSGPLVVIVDGATAMGGEMFAALMKSDGRALLVGGKTWGIGSIQALVDLGKYAKGAGFSGGPVGQLKISLGEFCVGPHGIEGAGVTPDIDWGLSTSVREPSHRSKCAEGAPAAPRATSTWADGIRKVATAYRTPIAMGPRAAVARAALDHTVHLQSVRDRDAERRARLEYTKVFKEYSAGSKPPIADDGFANDIVAWEALRLLAEMRAGSL